MAIEGPNGFKERSDAWYAGPRNKVVVIDNALAAYHANDATFSRAARLTALQGIIDLCAQYLALDPATTNATRRAGVTALRDKATNERQDFAALVDWDNVPASFKTKNTENKFPDSEYTVNATGYQRYAPVNTVRAQRGALRRNAALLLSRSDLRCVWRRDAFERRGDARGGDRRRRRRLPHQGPSVSDPHGAGERRLPVRLRL